MNHPCEICGHYGPDVHAQLEDGEQGTYLLVCDDANACNERFHAQLELDRVAVEASWGEAAPADYDAMPF